MISVNGNIEDQRGGRISAFFVKIQSKMRLGGEAFVHFQTENSNVIFFKYHNDESTISMVTHLERNPIIKSDIQKEACDGG